MSQVVPKQVYKTGKNGQIEKIAQKRTLLKTQEDVARIINQLLIAEKACTVGTERSRRHHIEKFL